MSYNTEAATNYECLTPEPFLRSLGEFDLDPAAPIIRPWEMAKHHMTIEDDGLKLPWEGRVWLNPEYGRRLQVWLQKMNQHRNGIVLIPSRTGSPWFHDQVYEQADAVFYLKHRLWFKDVHGNPILNKQGKPGNAGHDSVLIPYGKQNIEAIMDSGNEGRMQLLRSVAVIVVTSSGIWRTVITRAISNNGGEAHVQDIYQIVQLLAPDKTKKNANWKAKVRQQLQYHFTRISEGYYTNQKHDNKN